MNKSLFIILFGLLIVLSNGQLQCQPGQHVAADNTCKPCPPRCKNCRLDNKPGEVTKVLKCFECEQGLVPEMMYNKSSSAVESTCVEMCPFGQGRSSDNSKCEACGTNCAYCAYDFTTPASPVQFCKACKLDTISNYVVDPANQKTCVQCNTLTGLSACKSCYYAIGTEGANGFINATLKMARSMKVQAFQGTPTARCFNLQCTTSQYVNAETGACATCNGGNCQCQMDLFNPNNVGTCLTCNPGSVMSSQIQTSNKARVQQCFTPCPDGQYYNTAANPAACAESGIANCKIALPDINDNTKKFCAKCLPGYVLSPQRDACWKCSEKVTGNATCQVCQVLLNKVQVLNGFQYRPDIFVEEALTTQNNDAGLSYNCIGLCQPGYFVNGTVCAKCQDNCLDCRLNQTNSSKVVCTQCDASKGFIMDFGVEKIENNTNNTAGAQVCNKTLGNCTDVLADQFKVPTYQKVGKGCIKECKPDPTTGRGQINKKDTPSECENCPTDCAICRYGGYDLLQKKAIAATTISCVQCVKGKVLKDDGTCGACSSLVSFTGDALLSSYTCAKCNLNPLTRKYECLDLTAAANNVCPKGWFYNKQTQTCQRCQPDCSECTDQNNCVTCGPGFEKKSQQIEVKVFQQFNNSGVVQVFNETQKKDSARCMKKQCPPGQYNNAGTCTACEASCQMCKGATANDCLVCVKGKIFVDGSCIDKATLLSQIQQLKASDACTTLAACATNVQKFGQFNGETPDDLSQQQGVSECSANTDCNNHGTCDTTLGGCTCDEGYSGKFCEKTKADLAILQQNVTDLVGNISKLIKDVKIADSAGAVSTFKILSSVGQIKSGFTGDSLKTLITLTNQKIDEATNVTLTSDDSEALFQKAGQLVGALSDNIDQLTTLTTSEQTTLKQGLNEKFQSIADIVAQNIITSGKTIVQDTKDKKTILKPLDTSDATALSNSLKSFSTNDDTQQQLNDTDKKFNASGKEKPGAKKTSVMRPSIQCHDDFINTVQTAGNGDKLILVLQQSKSNPYGGDSTSAVLGMTVKKITSSGSEEVSIADLTEGCTVCIGKTKEKKTNATLAGQYWNKQSNDWDTSGIKLINESDSRICYNITHLTEFSTAQTGGVDDTSTSNQKKFSNRLSFFGLIALVAGFIGFNLI